MFRKQSLCPAGDLFGITLEIKRMLKAASEPIDANCYLFTYLGHWSTFWDTLSAHASLRWACSQLDPMTFSAKQAEAVLFSPIFLYPSYLITFELIA